MSQITQETRSYQQMAGEPEGTQLTRSIQETKIRAKYYKDLADQIFLEQGK